MLKIYETIGTLNRHTVAQIDGIEVYIHFENGTSSPKRQQGRYATANPKIQEFLETSQAYNVRWKLVSGAANPPKSAEQAYTEYPHDDLAKTPTHNNTDPNDDDLGTSPGSVVEETDEDIMPETEPSVDALGDIVVGEEVVNGQQARNYLMEHVKNLTFRQVSNNQQIISVAKENHIQFTHWEAFVTEK